MAAGLTKAERLAVDAAIRDRIDSLESSIEQYREHSGLATVIASWQDQRVALISARPKVAALRRTR